MTTISMRAIRRSAVFVLAALALACDGPFDVQDLNNPGLEQLEGNPTPAAVIAAAQGLLIGARNGHVGQISTTSHLGILGRESLVFDPSDPRYMSEILQGDLDAGNGAFGGSGWSPRYANLRNATILLNALDQVVGFSAEETNGFSGFAKTIMALDLYWAILLRNENGAVIDVNRPFADGPGPIVARDAVFDEVERLLDDGRDDLAAAGSAFAFGLTTGFAGFDTPATFQQFNRALKARVQVIRGDYGDAVTTLDDSWVSQTAALDLGVYHTFSTADGDATNGLFQGDDPQIMAHPSLVDEAQAGDDRFEEKIGTIASEKVDQGMSSDVRFLHYPSPASPLSIIRNEELLLLRAEARWFTGDEIGALDDLNHVRTESGGLGTIVVVGDDAFVDALLYERLWSLLLEGGHRYIDMRRFDRLDELPIDRAGDVIPTSFPIPRPECLARGIEGACSVSNQ